MSKFVLKLKDDSQIDIHDNASIELQGLKIIGDGVTDWNEPYNQNFIYLCNLILKAKDALDAVNTRILTIEELVAQAQANGGNGGEIVMPPIQTINTLDPFNDGSLKNFFKFDGTLNDSVGLYTAGYSTGITYETSLLGNKCARFNPALSSSMSLSPAFATLYSPFTISFWFKNLSPTSNQTVIGNVANTNYAAYFTNLGILWFATSVGGVASCRYPQDSEWHHYVITAGGSTLFKMYIDGVEATLTTNTINNPAIVAFKIGSNNGGSYPMNGYIQNLRIFNKYIDSTSVKVLYDNKL